ncbi:MAG: hypothetical protein M3Q30_15295 [Actinomycetota bacterium]|nr:hypothetical protein [Actinomycetota bacterium]
MARSSLPNKFDRVGIAMPPKLAQVFALDRARTEIQFVGPRVDDIAADIRDGRLTDPDEYRARVERKAVLLACHDKAVVEVNEHDAAVEHRTRVALRADADEIVVSMRPTFERAVAGLLAGLDALGPDPKPENQQQSAGLARAYNEWYSSKQEAEAVAAILREIDRSIEEAWYVDGNLDPAHADYIQGGTVSVWALIRTGHEAVQLNTLSEARAIIAASQQAVQTAAEQAEADRAAEQAERKAQLAR